jgi:hypothetical protein
MIRTVTGLIACPPFIFRALHPLREVPVGMVKTRPKLADAGLSVVRMSETDEVGEQGQHPLIRTSQVCVPDDALFRPSAIKYKRYLFETFRMGMHIGTTAS